MSYNKLVSLIGPGSGPRIQIGKFKRELKVRVCGLTEGHVSVTVVGGDGDRKHKIDANGDFAIPVGDWVCMAHENGRSKDLVCFILGR